MVERGKISLKKLVLVLNQNYEPLSITKLKRALILIYLGKAETVEEYPLVIHTVSQRFVCPSIVRLVSYIKLTRPSVPLTRKNIFKRDNYTCQYCGSRGVPLTCDHVIPKTMGGSDSWENLVTCCMKCNSRKGSRTLEEAGFKLARRPKKPHYLFILYSFSKIPDAKWKSYLFLE